MKSKKGTRKAVALLQKHKSHNKIQKRKKNSSSGLVYATNDLKRGMKRIGRIVKNLPQLTEKRRKLALKRLQKVQVANRSQVKGAAAKKEEKK